MNENLKIDTMQLKAKNTVVNYYNSREDKTDKFCLQEKDVFVVWFCKTLQNWKAILSTNQHDGRIYEVTYNGDTHETYLDSYIKEANRCDQEIR